MEYTPLKEDNDSLPDRRAGPKMTPGAVFGTAAAIKACLLMALLMAALIARADEPNWVINVQDADINEFISQVASITGRTFVVDPRVKGNVTVVSNTRMGADAIYALFLSVLRVHNFVATPSGDIIRIQAAAIGKQGPGVQGRLGQLPPESLVTRVVPAKHASATELTKVLRPLIPQYGHIAAIEEPNAVIISDHANNIQRLTALVERIDVVDDTEVAVVPLTEASVSDVVELLQTLAPEQIGASAKGPQRVQLVANQRNNSLVVRAKPGPLTEVLKLVEKLDQPSSRGGGSRVFYLKHATAADLAPILTDMVAQPGASAPSEVVIRADESLNAILIRADRSSMAELQGLLASLDVPRTQVLIEAAVVEVNLSSTRNIGVEAAIVDADGLTTPLASTTLDGAISSLLGNLAANADGEAAQVDVLAGLASISSPSLAVARINPDGVSFGGIVRALATSGDANLLSTPSIMALDNQEATIVVGREVPFRSGSFTTTGDGVNNPFTTVNRKDVGLTLKVTPHVHEGTSVRMDVDQEITNLIDAPIRQAGLADVVTSKRQITTTILAEDRQIIVLGGLIQDDVVETRRKVPLLGDIPGLGNLFRSTTRTGNKTNLLVFLRPTVIKSPEDATASTTRKYRDIWEVEITSPVAADMAELFRGER